MTADAPEHAPRPRLVPWLVAGAAIVSGGVGLAAVAWFALPIFAPEWVCHYSPWVGPVVRAAWCSEARESDSGAQCIWAWARQSDVHAVQLEPFLGSPDHQTRRIAVAGLARVQWMLEPPSLEHALLRLLDDADPEIRKDALTGLTDADVLPALEARGTDPDPSVAALMAYKIDRFRAIRRQQ